MFRQTDRQVASGLLNMEVCGNPGRAWLQGARSEEGPVEKSGGEGWWEGRTVGRIRGNSVVPESPSTALGTWASQGVW